MIARKEILYRGQRGDVHGCTIDRCCTEDSEVMCMVA